MSPHSYTAGFTHASNVNAAVIVVESLAGTCRSSLTPSNWTLLPYIPAAQAAPWSTPALPWPDPSATMLPTPSPNATDRRGADDAAAAPHGHAAAPPTPEPAPARALLP